jgi:hypothetical protein
MPVSPFDPNEALVACYASHPRCGPKVSNVQEEEVRSAGQAQEGKEGTPGS